MPLKLKWSNCELHSPNLQQLCIFLRCSHDIVPYFANFMVSILKKMQTSSSPSYSSPGQSGDIGLCFGSNLFSEKVTCNMLFLLKLIHNQTQEHIWQLKQVLSTSLSMELNYPKMWHHYVMCMLWTHIPPNQKLKKLIFHTSA